MLWAESLKFYYKIALNVHKTNGRIFYIRRVCYFLG